jgi:hypothetical protein
MSWKPEYNRTHRDREFRMKKYKKSDGLSNSPALRSKRRVWSKRNVKAQFIKLAGTTGSHAKGV